MKRKKKNPTLDIVRDTVIGGIGLSVGSKAIDKVAGSNVHAQKVAGGAQGALGLASIGLPINAAGKLMKQTDDMMGMQKKKKRRR